LVEDILKSEDFSDRMKSEYSLIEGNCQADKDNWAADVGY
jgi:hypothetical protein